MVDSREAKTSGMGTLYILGVGPGDPELMTIKAARLLGQCEAWVVPTAHAGGPSTALAIAEGSVSSVGKRIIPHHFPMKQVHRDVSADPEVKAAWVTAATLIYEKLKDGNDVAFPTLGDPAIYSTSFYVCEVLQELGYEVQVEVVPGVSAIGATAAAAKLPLCLGDEHLVVIPATFEDDRIRNILEMCDSVAFMKVHRVLPKLIKILEEFGLVENAVLIEKTSLAEQKIWTNILSAQQSEIHYFSTLIVRKNKS